MSPLVIFDCDGVLVDSEPIANRILAQALSAAGLAMSTAQAAEAFVGLSMGRVAELAEARLGRALPAGFLAAVERETFAAFERALEPVAGIEAALDAITAPVCVASSGDHGKIRLSLTLTGLWPRFAGRIFSASEVERGKPAPDLFLYAARRLGHAPGHCTVIEDSLPGVLAARAAGMRVLGYASDARGGRGHAERLAAAGAEPFGAMAELPHLLGPAGKKNRAR